MRLPATRLASFPPAPKDRVLPAVLLAVAVAAALTYAPSLRNGFVYDDEAQILANRWVTGWRYLPDMFGGAAWDFHTPGSTNYYRPLMHVTYLALYQVFGRTPWPFHLVNVLLNVAAAALVALLAGEVAGGDTRARFAFAPLVAGLAFAVHPVHVEPVAWIAGLPDLAAAVCALFAAVAYARCASGRVRRRPLVLAAAALAFFVGGLFKETALLLVPVLVCYEVTFCGEDRVAARLRRLAPFGIAAAAYLALRVSALHGLAPKFERHDLAPAQMAFDIPALFARYLLKLFVPVPANAYPDVAPVAHVLSPLALASTATTVAFVAVAILAWRKDRAIFFGLVLLLAFLVPALYLPAVSGALFAERYLYLPSAGFALALGALAGRFALAGAARIVSGLLVVGTTAGVALSVARIGDWHDDLALWSDTVAKSQDLALPHYNLGAALRGRGDPAGAAREFRAALERHPTPLVASLALTNLGRQEEDAGRIDAALELYERAVAVDPDNASGRSNLGALLAERGRVADAVPHLSAAVRIRPDDPDARFNLGMALLDLGRPDEAAAELQAAADLAPGDLAIRARLEAVRAARHSTATPGGK